MQVRQELQGKYDALQRSIGALKKVLVAFSGGVDSTFLLKTCIDVLGRENVLAFTGLSPTYPHSEKEEAQKVAASMGVRTVTVNSSEMEDENFLMNTPERCYHCKSHLFTSAWEIAREEGCFFVLEGSNVDDLKDFRPGRKACTELDVKSPLLEAGLTKDEIRILSRKLGLATHNKPAQACLSSRIPYGVPITLERLGSIERSEAFLRALGMSQVRVRHHGNIARIEVEEKDFPIILKNRDQIATELERSGFTYITLDLHGYRTGSMNETIKKGHDE